MVSYVGLHRMLSMVNFGQALKPDLSHVNAVQGGPSEAARLVHRVMDRSGFGGVLDHRQAVGRIFGGLLVDEIGWCVVAAGKRTACS